MLARVTCADCPVELRTGEVRPIDAIDVTFDFRDDSAGGDPDTDSPTLRRYHQLLWSKPLPNGVHFVLDATTPYAYLHQRSALGESYLASDSVIATSSDGYACARSSPRYQRWRTTHSRRSPTR